MTTHSHVLHSHSIHNDFGKSMHDHKIANYHGPNSNWYQVHGEGLNSHWQILPVENCPICQQERWRHGPHGGLR